ncbi:hypothetical protein AAC387_Pa07g2406 [Persea americana]
MVITSQSNIPVASPLTIYFGVHIFFGCPRFGYFARFLDSMRAKLFGGKKNFSSFAARLLLVCHVLASMPIHISLSIPSSKKVKLSIVKIMRDFLWSANH